MENLENKTKEQLLKESEEKYRGLYHSIRDSIMVADINRNIIDCNPAFYSLFGYSEEEIIGKQTVYVYESEDEFNDLGESLKAHYGEKPFLKTVNYKKKSGEIFPGETNVFYLKNDQGNVSGFIGLIRDITERKESLLRLEENEKRLQKFLNSLNAGVIVHGPETSIISSNPRASELLGLTIEQLKGREAYHPDWKFLDKKNKPLPVEEYPVNKIISTKKAIEEMVIGVVRPKTKDIVWLMLNGIPFYDTNGNLIEIITSFIDITERKQSEKTILESAEKFKSIFDLSPLGKSITNIDGTLEINRAFSEMLGYTIEELKSKNWKYITHPDDIQESADIVQSLLDGKTTKAQYEKRYLHKNGDIVWTEIITTLIRDEENNPKYFQTTINNISERKQAQDALRESEEKYRHFFEHNNAIILFVNPDNGKIIFANNAANNFYGYKSEQWAELSVFDINTLSPAEITKKIAAAQLKKQNHFILKHKLAGGEIRDVEVYQSKLNLNNQDVFSLIVHDITDRKRAEERIIQEKNKAQQYLDIADVMLVSIDSSGIVQLINPKGCEILGYSEEEIVGQNWFDFFLPERLRENVKEVSKKVFSGEMESVKYYENEILTKSGEERIIAWHNSVYKDDNGKIIGTLSSGEDITDRKLSEEKLILSDERYRLANAASDNGIWDWYIDSNIVFYSEQWKAQLGYKPDEIANEFKTWEDLLHPDDKDQMIKSVMNFLANPSKYFKAEFRMKHKDGSYRWIYNKAAVVLNEEGKVIRMFGAHTDITDRKLSEEALQISEERNKKILISAPLPLCYVNKEGAITFRNERFIQVFGWDEVEVPTIKEWWEKAYPDEEYRNWVVPNWEAAVEKAAKTGADIASEMYKVTCKDGAVRDIIISGTTLGENLLATFIDFTERKLSEKMLRDEKERLRTILDLVGDPIFVKNNDHQITLANQAFYDMFEMDEESVLGKTLIESVPEKEKHHFLKVDRMVLDTGIPDIREEELTVGENTRTIITRKIRFINESGKSFLVGSIHDITDRKLAEIKLLREKEISEEIINALPGVFYQISPEGKFVIWNKDFETISGFSNAEMGQINPIDLFDGEDKKSIAESIEHVFSHGSVEVEADLTSKNGNKVPYLFSGKRILIDESPVLVGMGIDVSSLKKVEAELNKHREELEQLVMERTSEVEEKNQKLSDQMKIFVGREIKIRDLEAKIKVLQGK